tara:strand:+ start:244 stop:495 length:252 start_codon:yes stop_codon:yes gene_type:complete
MVKKKSVIKKKASPLKEPITLATVLPSIIGLVGGMLGKGKEEKPPVNLAKGFDKMTFGRKNTPFNKRKKKSPTRNYKKGYYGA